MGIYHDAFLPPEALTAALNAASNVYESYSTIPDSRGDKPGLAKDWQLCAWDLYDRVAEFSMASRLTANSASMAPICPARYDGCDTVNLDYTDDEISRGSRTCAGEDGELDERPLDPQDVRAAEIGNKVLAQVFGKFGQSQVLRILVENLFVSGEAWLVQIEDPITFELRNEFEVVNCTRIMEDPMTGFDEKRRLGMADHRGQFRPFQRDRSVIRFVFAHPKDPQQPTSSIRAVLEEAKLVVLLRYLLEATAKSGIHGGIQKMPNEIAATQEKRDKIKADMYKSYSQTLADPGHPQSVAPGMVWGDAEYLKAIEFERIERAFDQTLPLLLEAMERRLIRGLDLPIEVITGIGEANHWSAWEVNSVYVRNHIQPILNIILETLTRRIYHRQLEENGFTEDEIWKYCFSADTTVIAGEPNKAKNANDAHDRGVLKHETYLDAMGFNPADDLADPIRQSNRSGGNQPIGEGVGGKVSTDRKGGVNPSRTGENRDNQPTEGRQDQ